MLLYMTYLDHILSRCVPIHEILLLSTNSHIKSPYIVKFLLCRDQHGSTSKLPDETADQPGAYLSGVLNHMDMDSPQFLLRNFLNKWLSHGESQAGLPDASPAFTLAYCRFKPYYEYTSNEHCSLHLLPCHVLANERPSTFRCINIDLGFHVSPGYTGQELQIVDLNCRKIATIYA